MAQHECPTCERTFDSRRGPGVHHSRTHDERLPNRECAECGTEFYAPYEQKYCSEDCRVENGPRSGPEPPNWQGGKAETTCDICGTGFDYYPSAKPGRYCPDCVETFERHPGNVDGERSFCSRDCQYEWLSEAFTGEGHPNWAGGGMPNYRGDWRDVRRRALDRDGHECVVCGAGAEELGRNPDVHHIVPVRAFADSAAHDREDAHFLDNVACLCPACHRKAEFGHVGREELRELVGLDAVPTEAVPDGR